MTTFKYGRYDRRITGQGRSFSPAGILSVLLTSICVLASCGGLVGRAGATASRCSVETVACSPLSAKSTSIYLYVNGVPEDVTTTCSIQGQHVFDAKGDQIGSINAQNNIVNESGTVIGYMQISGN